MKKKAMIGAIALSMSSLAFGQEVKDSNEDKNLNKPQNPSVSKNQIIKSTQEKKLSFVEVENKVLDLTGGKTGNWLQDDKPHFESNNTTMITIKEEDACNICQVKGKNGGMYQIMTPQLIVTTPVSVKK